MWRLHRITLLLALAAIEHAPNRAFAVATTTVTFQNGAGGYTGTFDRKISTNGATEVIGSSVLSYSINGGTTTNDQALIRFDNIVGNSPGQIPSGAFILDAKLQLTTSSAGGSQTTGPYGVAGLLAPFNSSTTYSAYGSRGAWWQDGSATRPTGGYGTMSAGVQGQANVSPIVQQWSSGTLANNGLVVQAGFVGTTDNWATNTTGHHVPASRPKLSVTYTTDSVEVNSFQRGLNGYTGDTMIWMFGWDKVPPTNITFDGLSTGQETLIGQSEEFPQELVAMLKFNNLFGAGLNQAPNDAPVSKAWLVMTTGDQQDYARSTGLYRVHALLRDWSIDSEYTHFGPLSGLTEEDGDIGPALDAQRGMIVGEEVWFDVTAYAEGVRNRSIDYGLAIIPGTVDEWLIHSNGSSLASARPRLVIVSELPEPTGIPGDYNDDDMVNAADYAVWRDHLASNFDLAGNGDETLGSAGVVDGADYQYWRENFGAPAGSGTITAVPEPASLLLSLTLTSMILAIFSTTNLRMKQCIGL